MIGQVENVTRFGLFVRIIADENDLINPSVKILRENADENSVSKKVGLLRWSAVPKGLPKIQIGDLIGISIEKEHENGKIDLVYQEKKFKSTYGTFLEKSEQALQKLQELNKEIR